MRHAQLLVIVFALLIIVPAIAPSPVQAAPDLQTVQPLYTQRDRLVTFAGSGFSTSQVYYLWVKGPNDNSTYYTGKSFSTTPSGLVPPEITLSISAHWALGTYVVSISTSSTLDNSQAVAHFGLWGTAKPLYQRTESVIVVGGGLFPGASFKMSIRNPAGDYIHLATIVSTSKGDFNYTWRIPGDAITETYKILIDGTGTFDDPQQDYVSETRFTVTLATLSAKVIEQPSASYQRTEKAKVSFTLRYPDGSPVVKSMINIRPVVLLQNQTMLAFAAISLVDEANGVWSAEVKLPINASISTRYRFELPASSFEDGLGNKGDAVDTFSDFFQVRNATLVITTEVNGTQIQIPFGQIGIISKVTYPDGMNLQNGTVRGYLSTGSSTSDLKLVYDPSIGAWRASYSSSFSDLWRVGTWSLRVEAIDIYANSGIKTYEIAAQPYLFFGMIGLLIAVVLFARWTVSKFGRKTYFRIRRLLQRLRRYGTTVGPT